MFRLILLILSIITVKGFTQPVEFPVDEAGKYTFSEVVELNGMGNDQLFENGEKFMKKIKVLHSKTKYLKTDQKNYKIVTKGSFYVYRLGSVKKGIGGAVEYDIILEFKESKYRYTITNFLFNEYKKNRYGKYEPVKGKYTPLEIEASSLNKKEWDKQRAVVFEKTQALIQNLYGQMIYAEEKTGKNKLKKENW